MKNLKKAAAMILALTLIASFGSTAVLAVGEGGNAREIVFVGKYGPDSLDSFSEGLATVESNGKWGYIDPSGKEAIPCRYTYAGAFSEGLAAVELDGKWGYIDQTGAVVVPLEFAGAKAFAEGLAAVAAPDGAGWGYIDKAGELVIPCQFEEACGFSGGAAPVRSGTDDGASSGYHYIDRTGRAFTDSYHGLALSCRFSEGFAAVERDGKYGYIDTTGKEVIPLQYEAAAPFSEGLAAVKANGKWGFIDTGGQLAIPMKYSRVESFSEGFAAAERNGKWSYLDQNGKEIAPFQFDCIDGNVPADAPVYSFHDGYVCVNLDGKFGYMNTDGEMVIPSTAVSGWDNRFSKGRFVFAETENGKKGVMDTGGTQIVPCQYDAVWFSEDLIIVEIGGERGVLSVSESDSGEGEEPEKPPVTLADLHTMADYNDIDKNAPAYDAAAYLLYRDVMYGQGGGRFVPDGAVTRAVAVAVLFRLSGEEAPEAGTAAFSDVAPDSWCADAVRWACARGIVVGGTGGSFHPNDPVTRAHFALMLRRYAEHEGVFVPAEGGLSAYTDAGKVFSYAKDALVWVLNSGYYKTIVDDTITPNAPVSRIQLAQILTGFCAQEDPLAAEVFQMQPKRTAPRAARNNHGRIQAAVDAAAKRYGAVGVQVAVIEDGQVTDTYVYGWATRGSDPMTADHKIRVASISKVVLGMTAMALNEEGKVNLDESIGKYWGFTVKNPKHPNKLVSIRTILTHTSTIINAGDNESRSYSSVKSRLQGSGFSGGQPGSVGYWSYNNYAFGVLGMTLELASKEYVDDILDRRFFGIMGIDGAFAPGTIKDRKHLTTLYYSGGTVSRTAFAQQGMGRWASPGASGTSFAGGLTISAKDMGKLVGLLASDGRYEGVRLLSADSVKNMETYNATQIPGGFYQAQPLRYRPGLYGRQGIYYHTGSAYGVYNCMSYDPVTRDGVVVLTVGASGAKDQYGIYKICSDIANSVYQTIA